MVSLKLYGHKCSHETKVMLSGTRQKLILMNDHNKILNVFLNGNKLKQVTSKKLLGVLIDESLSWKQQIKVIKRAYKISLLRRIKKYIPVDVRKTFHNYYIRPHFNYCSSVWGNCSETDINTMTKLQKMAGRLILDCDYSVSLIELFKTLNWQHFEEIVKNNQALLVYKSLNNLAPNYMSDYFVYFKNTTSHYFRSGSNYNLYIPHTHRQSLRYKGPKIWNSLSQSCRHAKTIQNFKKF